MRGEKPVPHHGNASGELKKMREERMESREQKSAKEISSLTSRNLLGEASSGDVAIMRL